MKTPDEKVLKTVKHLLNSEDFKEFVIYLKENYDLCKEQMVYNISENDMLERGYARCFADILKLISTVSSSARKS